MQALELARFADLSDIEKALRVSRAQDHCWLCVDFDDSTAADFYLVARLRHMLAADPACLCGYPMLRKYARSDPACSRESLLQNSDSEDEEAGAETSSSSDRCVVS